MTHRYSLAFLTVFDLDPVAAVRAAAAAGYDFVGLRMMPAAPTEGDYPILTDDRQAPMAETLRAAHPDALSSEIRFPPARPGHGMVGSGMFVINPPYGLSDEAARIGDLRDAVALVVLERGDAQFGIGLLA